MPEGHTPPESPLSEGDRVVDKEGSKGTVVAYNNPNSEVELAVEYDDGTEEAVPLPRTEAAAGGRPFYQRIPGKARPVYPLPSTATDKDEPRPEETSLLKRLVIRINEALR